MAARKPLIAGNWKMYGRAADLGQIAALAEAIGGVADKVDALICPPAPYIPQSAWAARGKPVLIGAQDCSSVGADSARTGEFSAAMLADIGAKYVIVGHSERRQQHGESDALVRQKAEAALAAGLTPIICVGETRAHRDVGDAGKVVGAQVRASVPETSASIVVAYEPVWCIGGDRTPSTSEISEIHLLVRETLVAALGPGGNDARILYGGSVGPANAGEIFAAEGVDGALVGRASLKATDFSAIILAHPAAS
jgi:triosephosphate isomerase